MQRENKNKIRRHAELDSASHLVAVLKSGEILKPINQTPYYNPTGRGQTVKAAVQDDNIFKGVGPVLRPYGAPLRSGFTLIELLVVVLIIGILAAVALPQYQKAVLKSRYATIKDLTYSIARAQEIYYLANGKYATDFEELAIDMPAGKLDSSTNTQYRYAWGYCLLKSQKMVACTDSRARMQLQVKYDHAYEEAGMRDCIAFSSDTNDIRNQLCRQETGGNVTSCVTDTYMCWRYQ